MMLSETDNSMRYLQVISIDTSKYFYNYIFLQNNEKDTILVASPKNCKDSTNTNLVTDSSYQFIIEEIIDFHCKFGKFETSIGSRGSGIIWDDEKLYILYQSPCLCGLRYIGCK